MTSPRKSVPFLPFSNCQVWTIWLRARWGYQGFSGAGELFAGFAAPCFSSSPDKSNWTSCLDGCCRFGAQYEVGMPDKKARRQILRLILETHEAEMPNAVDRKLLKVNIIVSVSMFFACHCNLENQVWWHQKCSLLGQDGNQMLHPVLFSSSLCKQKRYYPVTSTPVLFVALLTKRSMYMEDREGLHMMMDCLHYRSTCNCMCCS